MIHEYIKTDTHLHWELVWTSPVWLSWYRHTGTFLLLSSSAMTCGQLTYLHLQLSEELTWVEILHHLWMDYDSTLVLTNWFNVFSKYVCDSRIVFVDFSSAFSTVKPMKVTGTRPTLGFSTTLCLSFTLKPNTHARQIKIFMTGVGGSHSVNRGCQNKK